MKTALTIGLCCAAALLLSRPVMAQENTAEQETLLQYYDRELFQWYSFPLLHFQGQSSDIRFGIDDSMKKALGQYEDTQRLYRSYRGKNIAGYIVLWGGMAAFIGSVAGIVYIEDFPQRGAALSGAAMGFYITTLISAGIHGSAEISIFNAVNSYNRHKISEYPQ
jgi:hypothetical protein